MQRINVLLSSAYDEPAVVLPCEAVISVEQSGLIIPQEIALRLRLQKMGDRNFTGCDGDAISVPQVGPVVVQAGKHSMTCSALVWGRTIRIGTTLLLAMGWEEIKGKGWIFTDAPIRIPTILPPKNDSTL